MILALTLFLAAASPASAADLLVAAASDLATSERALRDGFEAETGDRVRFAFHSSGMLARQIEHGAPYDVYLSANEQYVNDLVASGNLLGETIVVYATGSLGLWSAAGPVSGIEVLLSEEFRHIAIANPAHAPYGVAAREALRRRELWEFLKPKVVFAENVRQTYQYGASGNADAIITSWTLVFDKGAKMLPSEWHDPIRQAGGVLKGSKEPEAARRFLRYLMSEAGLAVLTEHGLFPPK